jgi:hypothetical protein
MPTVSHHDQLAPLEGRVRFEEGCPRQGEPGGSRERIGPACAAEHWALPHATARRDAADHSGTDEACPGVAVQGDRARRVHPARRAGSELHATGPHRERGGRAPHPEGVVHFGSKWYADEVSPRPKDPIPERWVQTFLHSEDPQGIDRAGVNVHGETSGIKRGPSRRLSCRPPRPPSGNLIPRCADAPPLRRGFFATLSSRS